MGAHLQPGSSHRIGGRQRLPMPRRREHYFTIRFMDGNSIKNRKGHRLEVCCTFPSLCPSVPTLIKLQIALPSSVAFSRLETSVPYFVVFSTTPRCPLVAREIAADATISVQLVKQIVVQQPQMTFPLTPPPSPSKESSPVRMLRRVARSNPRLKRKRSDITGQDTEFRDKPLPDIPLRTSFSETKTVHSNFVIGFSKRPRHACEPKSHPSLEEQSSLPDGLHKGKINLHKDMLPSIDCEGVSVKVCCHFIRS